MKRYILLITTFIVFSCTTNGVEPTTKTRKFYMGVTPWPGNFSFADLDIAYDFINSKCDIVSHHFDEGIPYEEAYNNEPMPIEIQQQIDFRNLKTNEDKKVLLSVSALDLTRIAKADYYKNSTVSQAIKDSWTTLPFDNPSVITAYINYVNVLIASLNPDYVNFGVESNVNTFNPIEFQKYKTFLASVYTSLKNSHPNLPLFISFIVDESNLSYQNATELLPYTDIIGLSAYPYTSISSSADGNTNPDLFPDNYFEKFIAMANKPFCFAETGYIAEDLNITSFNLNKQGNPEWQKKYLEKIINLCQSKNATFLIWFCSKDYDYGNLYLQQQNQYFDLLALWQDIGLIDQDNNKRPSYYLWENWYSKTKN